MLHFVEARRRSKRTSAQCTYPSREGQVCYEFACTVCALAQRLFHRVWGLNPRGTTYIGEPIPMLVPPNVYIHVWWNITWTAIAQATTQALGANTVQGCYQKTCTITTYFLGRTALMYHAAYLFENNCSDVSYHIFLGRNFNVSRQLCSEGVPKSRNLVLETPGPESEDLIRKCNRKSIGF